MHQDWTRERGRIEMLTYVRNVGYLKNEMRFLELEFHRKDTALPERRRPHMP